MLFRSQGLGAPFWDSDARAAILGMTRAATKEDIVAAGLEAVAFQTRDLLDAMAKDMAVSGMPSPEIVRVDGGMTANGWFMQRLADILQKPVESALMVETTALGAAYNAGQAIGFYGNDSELGRHRVSVRTFAPEMSAGESAERHAGWLDAVSKVRS